MLRIHEPYRRYRHTANAVAELLDNSIDARANRVDVLIREEMRLVKTRSRWQVSQLAVFDNGEGMSAHTLVQALRFGGRGDSQTIHKIGKYGMGLPTASVSQCKRVDVWSWQDGIDNAAHSYIDVDAVGSGDLEEVPVADDLPVPDLWLNMASPDALDNVSGTLVVWSKLDRITARSETIFNKVEQEIGRIYRHFINEGRLAIRMAAKRNTERFPYTDKTVRPNDPLYLMRNSATPKPYDNEPMFEPYADKSYDIIVDGRAEFIEVNYSIANPEILGQFGDYPGLRDYGKHARQNMGVSVVREDREILLQDLFIREGGGGALPQNRWWGCEVKFGSGCDDLFGVDHNKQMAAHFSSIAKDVSDSVEADSDVKEEIEDQTDLYDIVVDIRNTTRSMMRELERMFKQRPRKHNLNGDAPESVESEAESVATVVAKDNLGAGIAQKTQTDHARETLDQDTRKEQIKQHFIQEGFAEYDADTRAQEALEQDKWFKFVASNLSGSQVFSVTRQGGILHVNLNINHPIYGFLDVIETEAGNEGNETARKAALSIRAMLLAWARMEDEIELESARLYFQDTCIRWGQMMRDVLNRLGVSSE